jgi:hypothetical protein
MMYWLAMVTSMLRIDLVKAITMHGLEIESIQEEESGGVTLLFELISVFIGLHMMPIVC